MNIDSKNATPIQNNMLVRVAILALWVALIDLWLARHFRTGIGIAELSMLVGVPLGSLWCVGVIDFLVDKEQRESAQKNLQSYFRHLVRTHLNTRVLVLLYLGTAVFTATFSTVSIGPVTGTGNRPILLTPIAEQSAVFNDTVSSGQVKDVHLWINPFAAQYQLSLGGYLPAIVTVKPFIGTLVIPDRDLVQTPTVLFRPSFGSYINLGSGGWFELYRKTEGGFIKVAEDQGTHAWYIGPRRNQPSELRSEWQIATKAAGLKEQSTAILMQRWRNPKRLSSVALGPQEIICALVTNIDRKVVAGVVGSIVKDEYIDLPLGEFQDDAISINSDNNNNAVCAWLNDGAS